MMTFCLTSGANPHLARRVRAIAALSANGGAIEPAPASVDRSGDVTRLGTLLDRLWTSDSLFIEPLSADGANIWYIPTDEAVSVVVSGNVDTIADSSVAKRHAKLARSSEGAVFQFPMEADGKTIDVFITDWSPCPAACAIAVHPRHWAARGVGDMEGLSSAFTGRYARHPLTGDLLPVWVADWVKPGFGTGAVLVNPAHDSIDLEFARKIGLPVRFALSPSGSDDSPESWPVPPVVKQGYAIRTGVYDGLPVAQAKERYFSILAERGFAKRHVDRKLPPQWIGKVCYSADGAWRFSPDSGRIWPISYGGGQEEGRETISVDLKIAAPVMAVLALKGSRMTLVVARTAIETDLLCFRLLRRIALASDAEGPVTTVIANEVELTGGQSELPHPLALLAAADPFEVAVVRPQVVEQIRTFQKRHAELIARPRSADKGDTPNTIGAKLDSFQTGKGFNALYKWQKDLFKDASTTPPAYCVLAERFIAAARHAAEAANG